MKDYPLLAFTGRAGPMYTHCQFRTIPWLRELRPEPLLMINTRTADGYGISSDDHVIVESPKGRITLKASVTEKIAPYLVYIPGGWENANFHNIGSEIDFDPISSQSNYMSCLCRIRKA
jgi:anaerobic selenocysteine-containing dehydrogenase